MSRYVVVISLSLALIGAGGAALASPAAPGDTMSTVTLFANFTADVVGSAPNVALPDPPSGDFLTLNQAAGTVRVNAAIDGLTMVAQMKQQSGAGGVSLFAWPAAPPAGTETVTVGWRSVAQDDNPINIVACTLRGGNGGVIASVEYGSHGALTWDGIVGAPRTLPVAYQQNRSNAFRLTANFLTNTVSLAIDGVAIAGFQNVPFAQPAAAVARLGFEAGGAAPQTFAVDDLYAVAFSRKPDRAPVLAAPASAAVEELGRVDVPVTASDPDGDAIAAITADVSALPAGNTATFTAGPGNASGTFSWSPTLGEAGEYPVVFHATANGATASGTTNLFVAALGTSITGRFIWTPQPGQEGNYIVTFIATDLGGTSTLDVPITVLPAGGALQAPPNRAAAAPGALAPQSPMKGPIISAVGNATSPTGGTITITSTATGDATSLVRRIELAPAPTATRAAAAGVITLTADLSGLPAGNDAQFFVDRDPVVSAPALKQGDAGLPLTVNVGADDPDADPIETLTADLSGLPAGNNASFSTNAAHTLGTLSWTPTLADAGSWTVSFRATNRLVGSASTVIHVRAAAATRVFTVGAKKLNLSSGKAFYQLAIEAVGASFDLMDVDLTSIVLISPGTGAVSQIASAAKPQPAIGDQDNNRTEEMTVAFTKADLRQLFGLLRGSSSVPVAVQGSLLTGGRFRGMVSIDVNAGGGKLAATVIPNPLNPEAVLRFVTTQSGEASVRLFDVSGRMIRELMPRAVLAAGEHRIAIRGEDASGRRLASGVYFYRVEAREGTSIGRIAVVK
jgi:hypothetical protein